MGTLASGNGDLKSVCLQNWSKWLNLLIKGESFVCFINGDPCGYSALFLFSVHTTPREFSQFEITKNAQNISLRPQPWTWGGDSFWQGWKICSWRLYEVIVKRWFNISSILLPEVQILIHKYVLNRMRMILTQTNLVVFFETCFGHSPASIDSLCSIK